MKCPPIILHSIVEFQIYLTAKVNIDFEISIIYNDYKVVNLFQDFTSTLLTVKKSYSVKVTKC